VIVLDENVFESQSAQLRSWRIHRCQIGVDVGRKGMQDDEILTLLRSMRRPTFISRDRDFFSKRLSSVSYCLVFLDVQPLEIARYVRRLMRHPEFKTWTQRTGCVARVAPTGLTVWRQHAARAAKHRWVD